MVTDLKNDIVVEADEVAAPVHIVSKQKKWICVVKCCIDVILYVAFIFGWLTLSRDHLPFVVMVAGVLSVFGWSVGSRGATVFAAWIGTVYLLFSLGIWNAKLVFTIATIVYFVLFRWLGLGAKCRPGWLRMGRITWQIGMLTAGIAIVSALCVLILVHWKIPNLPGWLETIHPFVLLFGSFVFAAGNAIMEEVVFRGIMMDAFEVEIGRSAACIAQATAFGAIHNHGVPAGTSGMLAAGVFGLLMGIIRYRTGGFISVCFCHFIVDLVIATWAVKSLVLIP